MHFLQSNNAPPWYLHPDDAHFLLVNDTYLQYDKQDQLIVVWLLASLTTLILIKMVRLESSHHIQTTLRSYFASHPRAKIKKLKLQLKTSKNDKTINTYLLDAKKTIVDWLTAVGAPISTGDHIDAILDGLSDEYDPFITTVTSRINPTPWMRLNLYYSLTSLRSIWFALELELHQDFALKRHFRGLWEKNVFKLFLA